MFTMRYPTLHVRRTTGIAAAASRGFTLLELLVVVAIIGLLAALVGPRVFGNVSKAKTTAAKNQIENFSRALENYRMDVGRFPDATQGLLALTVRPQNEPKWNGPYLQKQVPTDPWGRPYLFKVPGPKSEFEVMSLGADGAPGGTGEDADITN